MNNWFYMDRMTFENVLIDELGPNLTEHLLSLDFDTPVSFMIGETPNEILTKIQQTFSRSICGKIICNDHCISCSQKPSTYAKLTWFVQRLLIMSPLSKPFVKKNSPDIFTNTTKVIQDSNDLYSERLCFISIILMLLIIISLLLGILIV